MNLDTALEYARAVGLTDGQVAGAVQAAADDVRFRRVADDQVVMTHPDLPGREIVVAASTVKQHEDGGWVVKTAGQPVEQPAVVDEAVPVPDDTTDQEK